MIVETLIDWVLQLFASVLSGIGNAITLPTNVISVLSTVTCYGNYIVGSDILLLIVGTAMFWITVKTAIGLFKFVWDLLPLT